MAGPEFITTLVTRLTFEPQPTLQQQLLLELEPQWLLKLARAIQYAAPASLTVASVVTFFHQQYHLAWNKQRPSTGWQLGNSFRLFVRLGDLEMAQYIRETTPGELFLQTIYREYELGDELGRGLTTLTEQLVPLPYEELIETKQSPEMILYLLELVAKYRPTRYVYTLERCVSRALANNIPWLFAEATSRLLNQTDYQNWMKLAASALKVQNIEALEALLEIELQRPDFDPGSYFEWLGPPTDPEVIEMLAQAFYQLGVNVDYDRLIEEGHINPTVAQQLGLREIQQQMTESAQESNQ